MRLVYDRRRLLTAAAGLGLAGGLADRAGAAPGLAEIEGYPFRLGVASGDPAPDGFVIWTRLAPRPLEENGGMSMYSLPHSVGWEVAEDDGFKRIVRSGQATAIADLAYSVHVEVEGLAPHRHYFYRFTAGGDVSPVGRVRTLPAAGASPNLVRLGVAGCQNWEDGLFTGFGHLARENDVDAVFHYGDYIYEGGSGRYSKALRTHVGDQTYSLSDYRRRYAQYKSDPLLQAAHASTAFISSFDDHEIDNNWAGDMDADGNPPEIFVFRKLAAMQAWYEHMPVRRAQFPGVNGAIMYRRFDFGGLVRMHALDTRSHRSDQPCNDLPTGNSCQPVYSEASTMLGSAQEAWLADGLSQTSKWNLIAQQVLVMPYDGREPGGAEPVRGPDNWNGQPAARQRLVKVIADRRLTNVVVSTGDAHLTYVGTVPLKDEAPDGAAAATEFLCSSMASGGNGGPLGLAQADVYRNNPNLRLLHNQRGYQLFDITPKLWRTQVRVIDRVDAPGGLVSTLKTYAVTPDRPELHEA